MRRSVKPLIKGEYFNYCIASDATGYASNRVLEKRLLSVLEGSLGTANAAVRRRVPLASEHKPPFPALPFSIRSAASQHPML